MGKWAVIQHTVASSPTDGQWVFYFCTLWVLKHVLCDVFMSFFVNSVLFFFVPKLHDLVIQHFEVPHPTPS